MTFKWKMRSAFALFVAILSALTLYSGNGLRQVEDIVTLISATLMPESQTLQDLDAKVTLFRVQEASHILSLTVEAMDAREAEMARLAREVDALIDQYSQGVHSAEEVATFQEFTDAWQEYLGINAELLPISAADGTNCDRLLDLIVRALPEHPPFFPADATSDQPETFYVAEVVREKVFHFTHQEVPYAVAVRVEELTERARPERLDIRATVFVEQESQKGILIGKGGAMLKQIGTAARRDLEAFFGIKVFLQSTVEVRRHWRRDERALREFGFLLTS